MWFICAVTGFEVLSHWRFKSSEIWQSVMSQKTWILSNSLWEHKSLAVAKTVLSDCGLWNQRRHWFFFLFSFILYMTVYGSAATVRQLTVQHDGSAATARQLTVQHFFLLFISSQIEEIQWIYNLICCLVILSWKGDHPTMSPQSCRSEVQCLFSLRLLIGCVSVQHDGRILMFLYISSYVIVVIDLMY